MAEHTFFHRGSVLDGEGGARPIVAAIFLPLGCITAVAGVSIAGIPAQHNPLAFWGLCAILACVLALEIVLLRRMRWMQHASEHIARRPGRQPRARRTRSASA